MDGVTHQEKAVFVKIKMDETITAADGNLKTTSDGFRLIYGEPALVNTKTMMRFAPDGITITRAGAYRHEMHFKNGQAEKAVYETPYGTMTLRYRTEAVTWKMDERGLKAEIRYKTDSGEQRNIRMSVTDKLSAFNRM